MARSTLPSRRLLEAALLATVIWVQWKAWRYYSSSSSSSRAPYGGKRGHYKNERIMVATSFGAHDDVYMSLVDTLESLLLPAGTREKYVHSRASTPVPATVDVEEAPSSPVRVYGRGLRYGLEKQVLAPLGIYTVPGSVFRPFDKALSDVDAGWDGMGADLVVLATCELDMKYFSAGLWEAWQARPPDRKFTVVCIVHNIGDYGWADTWSGDWSRVGALRILPISEHVAKAEYLNFINYADKPSRYHLGYQYVPIHPHIPILPIERLPGFNAHGKHDGTYAFSKDGDGLGEVRKDANLVDVKLVDTTWGRRDGKVLRDVVIQGNFELHRRNYFIIFQDLESEIAADPAAWGYLPLTHNESAPFVPANKDNFVLHIAGNGNPDHLEIPPRLSPHVVKLHKALSYPDFFSLVGSMDLVMPAFKDGGGYYDRQASSTVAMAMQCETPLLVTSRIMDAYTYLTPKTTVLRPQTLPEIQAIKILRTSTYTRPALGYDHEWERSHDTDDVLDLTKEILEEEHPMVRVEAEAMIKRGWTTKAKDWKEFKKGILKGNQEVVRHMILER